MCVQVIWIWLNMHIKKHVVLFLFLRCGKFQTESWTSIYSLKEWRLEEDATRTEFQHYLFLRKKIKRPHRYSAVMTGRLSHTHMHTHSDCFHLKWLRVNMCEEAVSTHQHPRDETPSWNVVDVIEKFDINGTHLHIYWQIK